MTATTSGENDRGLEIDALVVARAVREVLAVPDAHGPRTRLLRELAGALENPDTSVSPRWARLRRLRISQLLNDINQLGDRDEQGLPINDPGLWLAEIIAQLVLDDRFDLGKAGEAVLNLHGHRLTVRIARDSDEGEVR